MRRRRPLIASVALLLLIPELTGCYNYVPVDSPSGKSRSVALQLTDRGRLAMTEAIGPGVRRMTGDVLSMTNSALVLSVATVEYRDVNMPVKWSGEQITVPRDFISEIRQRRLSQSRTIIAAGLIVVGVITSTAIAIGGFGSDTGTTPGGGDPGQSIKRIIR